MSKFLGLPKCPVKLTSLVVLDERIDAIADLVCQHYGLNDLGDPSASSDVSHVSQFRGVAKLS